MRELGMKTFSNSMIGTDDIGTKGHWLESLLGDHETARSYAERSIQVHRHSFGFNTLGTVLLRIAIQRGDSKSLIQGIEQLARARNYQNWGERAHPFVTFLRH